MSDLLAALTAAQSEDDVLAGPAFFRAHGFPLVQPGLFMGYFGPVFVSFLGRDLTAAGATTFIEQSMRALDATPADMRVVSMAVLQDGPWWTSLSLSEKTQYLRRYGEGVTPRKEHIARVVRATSNVVGSVVTRTAMRTLNVFAPPPCPQTVVPTMRQALTKLSLVIGELSTHRAILERSLRTAVARHVPSIEPLY